MKRSCERCGSSFEDYRGSKCAYSERLLCERCHGLEHDEQIMAAKRKVEIRLRLRVQALSS